MSWDEAFSHRYDEWAADMTADIDFYVRLAREADGPLVELAVGNGRVAIPVGRATGRRVIGLDTSPAMLEQALLLPREAPEDGGVLDDLIVYRLAADRYRIVLNAATAASDLAWLERLCPAGTGLRARHDLAMLAVQGKF